MKKLPRTGYHQAMYRAVFTLLVGLMLSLGNGASGLTFKSDGTASNEGYLEAPPSFAEIADTKKLVKFSSNKSGEVNVGQLSRCTAAAYNLYMHLFKCNAGGKKVNVALRDLYKKHIHSLKAYNCYVTGWNHFDKLERLYVQPHQANARCSVETAFYTVDQNKKLLLSLDEKPINAKTSPNNRAPSEFLEPIQIDSRLITLRPIINHARTDFSYDGDWNVCSATEHNLAVMLQKCPLAKNHRAVAVKEAKQRRLREFQCGEDGYQRYQDNIPSQTRRGLNHDWIVADCTDEKIDWTIDQYKRLTAIIDSAPSIETSVVEVAGLSASGSDTQTQETAKPSQTIEIAESTKKQTDNLIVQTPEITIQVASTVGPKGTIKGVAQHIKDLSAIRVDGQSVDYDEKGNFQADVYVPDGGLNVVVEAFDVAGVSASTAVRLDRTIAQSTSLTFKRLNPIQRDVAKNPNALALVIGVANYRETGAKAVYADSDAKVFVDYAAEKLGVPRQRIKFLVNEKANEKEMLLATKRWLARAALPSQSDIYVFFAGHGLASDDGKKMYLLPYDGAPELLDKTAILRDELFADIAQANPRSVTVFLDTCYSGTTRGPDMLIASRPIAIRAKEQAVPEGFTVMTAAAGDQTAKPLEEAKHGMFSYFLMKGMEGDADANQDNQITAGELHAYVQQNVIQQSSGSQTPELQGDAERVLIRFQ